MLRRLIPFSKTRSKLVLPDSARSPLSLTIRPMGLDHLEQVLMIEQQAYSTPWSRETFLQEIHDSSYSLALVGLSGERVVGYIIAWPVIEELHIGNVAVCPFHRRQGIAKKLLNCLFEKARQRHHCRCATLEVRQSNEAAQKLYEGLGFYLVGVRAGYYQKPREDALVMVKDLMD